MIRKKTLGAFMTAVTLCGLSLLAVPFVGSMSMSGSAQQAKRNWVRVSDLEVGEFLEFSFPGTYGIVVRKSHSTFDVWDGMPRFSDDTWGCGIKPRPSHYRPKPHAVFREECRSVDYTIDGEVTGDGGHPAALPMQRLDYELNGVYLIVSPRVFSEWR